MQKNHFLLLTILKKYLKGPTLGIPCSRAVTSGIKYVSTLWHTHTQLKTHTHTHTQTHTNTIKDTQTHTHTPHLRGHRPWRTCSWPPSARGR